MWWLAECGHEWETRVTYRTIPGGGTGCPRCVVRWSRAEKAVAAFIAGARPDLTVQENVYGLLPDRREIDIYLPELRIGIEFNGLYWHDEADARIKARHDAKRAAALDAGITLLVVWEDAWTEHQAALGDDLLAVIDGSPVPDWLRY